MTKIHLGCSILRKEINKLRVFESTIEQPLEYIYTGKFEAPSPNWIHENADLKDYELFVITKGPLYISYQNENYTVNSGEILLLPPGDPPHNMRNGFRPSDCSFYWMHFNCKHPINFYELEEDMLVYWHQIILNWSFPSLVSP